jgi:excisionase family DNA binding protein
MEAPGVKYLTVTEVAESLHVDRVTVWRWVSEGKLKGTKRRGIGATSAILIPEPAVIRLIEEHNLAPATPEE